MAPMDVPSGKPLADRLVEIPAGVGELAALITRPPRNTRTLELAPPGPRSAQGRVDVPVMPGGGR